MSEQEQDGATSITTDLQTLTISDPLSNQYGTLSDLCFEIQSLQDLANRGSWRSILDKIARARKLSLLQKPDEHFIYLCYNVLSLIKLRKYIGRSRFTRRLQ